MVVDPGAIAADVELEDSGTCRGLGDHLHRRFADGAEEERDAGHARAPGDGLAAARGDLLEAADRGEGDGQADGVAEEACGRVDSLDVDQHAGAEADAVEGEAVAAHGGLGGGAADEVVPDVLVEVVARGGDDLVEELEAVVLVAAGVG